MDCILLLGGTSESAPLAHLLQNSGFKVLVSTATDAPLDLPHGVVRQSGRLDENQLSTLAKDIQALAIVDAGHPFAVQLHACCLKASAQCKIPCLRYLRTSTYQPKAPLNKQPKIFRVDSHEAAAALAFSLGGPVFLTTGSRNLNAYARQSKASGNPLVARILDHEESLKACQAAGLAPSQIIAQRGPFTLEDNLEHLKRCQAKALVTKESGDAGGLQAKLEAAYNLDVQVVIIEAPPISSDAQNWAFIDMAKLVEACLHLSKSSIPNT